MLADSFTAHLNHPQEKAGYGQRKPARFSRWVREEQISAFLTWLPRELHDAPGIDWTHLSIQAAGYLVRNVAGPDAAYLAVAAASAMDAISDEWLLNMLCSLHTLLTTMRTASGVENISDLSHEQIWHTLAGLPTNVRAQLKAYSSARKHILAYLERLDSEERQRMQRYALPPIPPGFLKQYTVSMSTQQRQQQLKGQQARTYIAEQCQQNPDVTCKELRAGLRSSGIRMGNKRINSIRVQLGLKRPGGSRAQHLHSSSVHAQARDWLAKERRQNPEVRVQELQAGLQGHFGIEIGTRQLNNILKQLGVSRSRYYRAHEEVSRKTNASDAQASTHER